MVSHEMIVFDFLKAMAWCYKQLAFWCHKTVSHWALDLSCALGKLVSLSVPQCPHLWCGTNTCCLGKVRRMQKSHISCTQSACNESCVFHSLPPLVLHGRLGMFTTTRPHLYSRLQSVSIYIFCFDFSKQPCDIGKADILQMKKRCSKGSWEFVVCSVEL